MVKLKWIVRFEIARADLPIGAGNLKPMMTFELGLYEQLINKLFHNKLQSIEQEKFYIKTATLDKEEAARYLSQYLSGTIQFSLNELKGENKLLDQVELTNKIIRLLIEELPNIDLSDNLLQLKIFADIVQWEFDR